MSELNFSGIFFTSFFIAALTYSFLSSFTKILFTKKPRGRLSHKQLKVLQGDATLIQRLEVFIQTFFLSILTPLIYVIAISLTIFYLLVHYLKAYI